MPQMGDEEGEGEGAVIFLEEEEGGEEVERDGGGVGEDVVVKGGRRSGGVKVAVQMREGGGLGRGSGWERVRRDEEEEKTDGIGCFAFLVGKVDGDR